MALTLDATIGGAAANAYADRATANAYFDGRPGNDAWLAASDIAGGGREQALVAATSRLEQERYKGMKIGTTQRLQWPRSGTYDPDGYFYPLTAIPRPVQEACFELALAILKSNALLSGNSLAQFADLSVGPIKLSLREGPTNEDKLPAPVIRLLRDLREWGANVSRIVRT
jgi:hypothetical protein